MEFLVTSSAVLKREVPAGTQEHFMCKLVNDVGEECYFDITLDKEGRGQKMYEAMGRYFSKGYLVNCQTAYLLRSTEFSLMMYAFTPIIPISLQTGRMISGENYLNPNRGFWVMSEPRGPYTHLPNIVMLHGTSQIPILDENCRMKHYPPGQYKEGLRWGTRRSWLGRLFS